MAAVAIAELLVVNIDFVKQHMGLAIDTDSVDFMDLILMAYDHSRMGLVTY